MILQHKKIVVAVLLATVIHQASAEEAKPNTPETLEEVKVKDTADARNLPKAYAGGQVARGARIGVLGNQDMMNVPFSFTSFTAKTIEDQQARTLADVLINDPSVRVGQAFGTSAQSFVIRGFTLGSEDVALNGLYGLLPRQLPALDNIERVDLFKGASAFLNGVPPSGSGIGGSLNLVPKRAGAEPVTRATLDYQNNSQFGGHIDIGRRFGNNQQFGVRLNATQRDGNTSVHDEQNQLTYIALGLDFVGDSLRLSSDIGYQKQDVSRPRLAVLMSGTEVPKAPRSDVNYSQPWTYTKAEATYAAFRGDYDFNDQLSAYGAIGVSHNNETGNTTSLFVGNTGAATPSKFVSVYNIETVSGEMGLRGKVQTGAIGHQFNLSASAVNSTARSDSLFNATPLATNIYNPVSYAEPNGGVSTGSLNDPDVTNRVRNNSYALSDTLSLLDDKVQVVLGLRHQNIHVMNYSAATGAKDDDSDKSITTPIYGVVFKPFDYLSLYANHIQGLSQGPVAPIGTANFGRTLSPMKSEQDEVGVKVDMGRVGGSIALFQIERPSTYTNAANVFVQDGEQRNRGIEVSVFGEPLEGWRVLGGATFTDAELTKTQGGTNDGNTAIGAPKNQYNLYTEYDVSALSGLALTGRWVRTGAQFVNPTNTMNISSWERFDLGARYQTQINQHKVTFRANLENVFDKDYWSAVAQTFGQVSMGLPRTFKLSGTIDF